MLQEIRAWMPGQIKYVAAAGAVGLGCTIFTLESMKMEMKFPAMVTGVFIPIIAVGVEVAAGALLGHLAIGHDDQDQ